MFVCLCVCVCVCLCLVVCDGVRVCSCVVASAVVYGCLFVCVW